MQNYVMHKMMAEHSWIEWEGPKRGKYKYHRVKYTEDTRGRLTCSILEKVTATEYFLRMIKGTLNARTRS